MRRPAKLASVIAALCSFMAIGSSQAIAACPNEAIRVAQGSTGLPECRAYEVVSPQAKGGVDVAGYAVPGAARASLDGDSIVYTSLGAFPGNPGAALPNYYRATRNGPGWGSEAIQPPSDATLIGSGDGLGYTGVVYALTGDLSRAVVTTNSQLVPGAPAGVHSLYTQANPGSDYTLLTPVGPTPEQAFADANKNPYFRVASDDLRHVGFYSTAALTPDAPDDGLRKLYVSHDGEVELASILPGEVPVSAGQENVRFGSPYGADHAISNDGRRVFFNYAGSLYVREGGTSTTLISDNTGNAGLLAATPDGSKVLFNGGQGISIYDVETGSTEVLGGGGNVLGYSRDLSRVYLASLGSNNLPGEPPAPQNSNYIYLAHDGDLEFVAAVEGTAKGLVDPQIRGSDDGWGASNRNGSVLAFRIDGRVIGADGTDSGSYSSSQVYAYDAASGELDCLSCPTAGPAGASSLWQPLVTEGLTASPHERQFPLRRNVSENGKVFFQTTAALVPGDSNGRTDVYMWAHDGQPQLLSSGRQNADAIFAEASPDGSNAFFVTTANLVGSDRDNLADVYAARVGGGFPEPPTLEAECGAGECRDGSRATPAEEASAWDGPAARGKSRARKPCAGVRKHARQLSIEARRLRGKAGQASGEQARKLNVKAKQAERKARKAQRGASACAKRGVA